MRMNSRPNIIRKRPSVTGGEENEIRNRHRSGSARRTVCEFKNILRVFPLSLALHPTLIRVRFVSVTQGCCPVLNHKAVELRHESMRWRSIAKLPQRVKFDRKNYFYPDPPKAYQFHRSISPSVRTAGLT